VNTFTEAVLYGLIYRYKYNTYKYRTKLKSDFSLNLISIAPCSLMEKWEYNSTHILKLSTRRIWWTISGPAEFTLRKQPLRITKQEAGCGLQPIQTLSRKKESLEGLRIICNNIYGLHTAKYLKHYASESLHVTCLNLSFLFV